MSISKVKNKKEMDPNDEQFSFCIIGIYVLKRADDWISFFAFALVSITGKCVSTVLFSMSTLIKGLNRREKCCFNHEAEHSSQIIEGSDVNHDVCTFRCCESSRTQKVFLLFYFRMYFTIWSFILYSEDLRSVSHQSDNRYQGKYIQKSTANPRG